VPDGTIPGTHAGVVGIEDKLGSIHLDAAALIKAGATGYAALSLNIPDSLFKTEGACRSVVYEYGKLNGIVT